MRRLVWFTLGFAVSCLLCAFFWLSDGLLAAMAALLTLAAAVFLGSRWLKSLRILAVFLIGAALGFGWFQLYYDHYLGAVTQLDEQEAYATVRCTDYAVVTDYGCRVDGSLYLDGKSYKTRLYLNASAPAQPGDMLTGVFRFRITTPDSDYDNTSYQGSGLYLIGYQVEDAELTKFVDTPIWAFPAIFRHHLLQRIGDHFPEDVSGFARALLLGDRKGIDTGTNWSFKVSGIMHIIAVSGLHVTILFALIYNLCLKRRFLSALIGIPLLALFALVGGFSPSIVRACIMQSLLILAMVFDREYDSFTELAFACLVMMAAHPLVVLSVSFQLSVDCMAGIFLFQKPIFDYFNGKLDKKRLGNKFKYRIAQSLSMTLSSMSLTTPMVAWYFGVVSLIGPVTNFLVLWVISFIFYGIMLVCLASWVLPAAATVLAKIIAWPIRYVLGTAKLMAGIPIAAVYTRSIYVVIWLVFVYVLLAQFLVSRKRNPKVFAACATVGLCLAIAGSWAEPMTDDCRLTVLDVGQGQSILFQSQGKTYLVDCGGDYDEEAAELAANTLLSQGIHRIDGLILTHFDRDHAGGVEDLLAVIRTDKIFLPDYEDEAGIHAMLREKAADKIIYVHSDLQLSYNDTKITIFAPALPDIGNESSLAVLFQGGNCDILVTGDRGGFGERILMKTANLPDLEVLVAGHHGARDSTCEELLRATTPEIVLISVGENHYGQPAPEVLERLQKYGCAVYRTDIQGNLIIRR